MPHDFACLLMMLMKSPRFAAESHMFVGQIPLCWWIPFFLFQSQAFHGFLQIPGLGRVQHPTKAPDSTPDSIIWGTREGSCGCDGRGAGFARDPLEYLRGGSWYPTSYKLVDGIPQKHPRINPNIPKRKKKGTQKSTVNHKGRLIGYTFQWLNTRPIDL